MLSLIFAFVHTHQRQKRPTSFKNEALRAASVPERHRLRLSPTRLEGAAGGRRRCSRLADFEFRRVGLNNPFGV